MCSCVTLRTLQDGVNGCGIDGDGLHQGQRTVGGSAIRGDVRRATRNVAPRRGNVDNVVQR